MVLEEQISSTDYRLANGPVVSVVIPCYNQAHFLAGAIDSALNQRYPFVEVVVVDDGSSDDTARVAARYENVLCIRQHNQGLSSARNAGWRASRGDLLVFLDADDFLLPGALDAGVTCLLANPDCAFTSGAYYYADGDGTLRERLHQRSVDGDHYRALLQVNYVGMCATVMYRRHVLLETGGFDTTLPACEDYDLYLRIARVYPVCCHQEAVAAYRQHGSNMSANPALMLKTSLGVLRKHQRHLPNERSYKSAYRTGLQFWESWYGGMLITELVNKSIRGDTRQLGSMIGTLLRHAPTYAAQRAIGKLTEAGLMLVQEARHSLRHLRKWMRSKGAPPVGRVRFGDLRRLKPISRHFGFDRGVPVDRYYIEKFLTQHAGDIRGRVLEIGDDAYTRRFGGDRVSVRDVLHVSEGNAAASFVGDLTTARHLPSDAFDCIILTQTLHLIYDTQKAIETVHRVLKPGGVLLATVPGISQISVDEWADSWYWAFTLRAVKRLFSEVFAEPQVQTEAHGNVLAAISFLEGLSAAELRQDELDYVDPRYQLLITIRASKHCNPS